MKKKILRPKREQVLKRKIAEKVIKLSKLVLQKQTYRKKTN